MRWIFRSRNISMVRRDFGTAPYHLPRVMPTANAGRPDPPGGTFLNKMRRPRRVRVSPLAGKALRVSTGAGFRLSTFKRRPLKVPLPRPAALKWRDSDRRPGASYLDGVSRGTAIRLTLSSLEARQPGLRVAERAARMAWPGAMTGGGLEAQNIALSPARGFEARRKVLEPVYPSAVPFSGQAKCVPRMVSVMAPAEKGHSAAHVALVPFEPQEKPFGYTPTFSAEVERPAAVTPPPATLEEHFENGWDNWIGGVEDWKLDVAGARTGSLALFLPSLEMGDYEFEFLARIDKTVTWVYRASDLRDYHTACVTLTAAGGYEFTHTAVAGGEREPASAPVRVTPNAKTFTVRMQAEGSEFTVWIDGQKIETWEDDRSPIGGIGFVGAPDDRARIYWVRLSPVGSGKEYSRR